MCTGTIAFPYIISHFDMSGAANLVWCCSIETIPPFVSDKWTCGVLRASAASLAGW